MFKYRIDASEKTLGRLAAETAVLLRGKNRADFVSYLEPENEVIIFNTDKIKITGKKLKQKIYYHHSGYPGGIKTRSLEEILKKDSREAVKRAVYGMLPKNKLRDKMIKRLRLYKEEEKTKFLNI